MLNSLVLIYKSVHTEVWSCNLDGAQTAIDLATLSDTENLRANSFFQEIHRKRYMAARVALRSVLSVSTGQPAAALHFEVGHSGKPFLARHPDCHFNLSHSDGVALIAVSSQLAVGVDIECASDLRDLEGLAKQVFCDEEWLAWCALPKQRQHDAFYRVWVFKEACIKATGWGLNVPLPSFDVGLESTSKTVTMACPDGSSTNVEVLALPAGRGNYAAIAWWHTHENPKAVQANSFSLTLG